MKRCFPPCGLAVLIAVLVAGWLVSPASAVTYTVSSASEFGTLPGTLQPGDVVLVKNGTYNAVQRTITAAGTVQNPVIFRAENPGQVFFSGLTSFRLKGTGMVVSGFVFDGDVVAGGVAGSALFRLDINSSDMVLRDIVVNNYDTGTAISGAFYVLMNGYRHTLEYCRFSRKQSSDPVINIIPQEDEGSGGTFPTKDVPRQHRIRYCYFGERTNIGENEYETIRIGESQYQMYLFATVVEHCVFERAIYGPDISNYEPEVISSKSRGNIYRYNTLIDCKGGIVLRHGDDCVVDGNFIFGEPGSSMGAGIRIIGLRHLIRNNYVQDVAGTGLRSPIVVMKGDSEFPDNSTNNGYETPSFARIFHNTIVNSKQPIWLGGNTSTSGSNVPRGVEIRGNVIVSAAGAEEVLRLNTGVTIGAFTFEKNFAYHPNGTYGDSLPATGLATGTPLLHTHDVALGYSIPQAGSPVIGQAPATTPVTLRDLRGRMRAATSDAGAFDTQATGTVLNRPLTRTDVGPSYDGRNSTAMAPLILTSPASQSIYEFSPATFSVVASSAEALTYQWFYNELPIVGATAASYSINSVATTDAGNYTVAVTNSTGTAFTVPATLSVTPVRPIITTQPSSIFRAVGDSASFTVAADGQAPFTYVWKKNNVPILGANAATLSLTNLQTSDAGSYVVEVSNSHGSATSAAAVLSMPAANAAIVVSDSFADGNRGGDNPPESLEWWSSSSSSGLTVANGEMTQTATGSRHIVAHFPSRTLGIGDVLEFRFNFRAGSTPADISGGLRLGLFHRDTRTKYTADSQNAATTLYPGYGAFVNLNPTTTPAQLRRRDSSTPGVLITAMTSYTTGMASGGPVAVFTANTPYVAKLLVERLSAETVRLTLSFTGGGLSTYSVVDTDSAAPITTFDTLAIAIGSSNSVPAVTSLIVADVVVLHLGSNLPVPPAITTPPAATTASVGGTAQFSVSATGTAPLTYQWFRGTDPIANSNSATLSLTNVQLADAGDYHVVVTNSEGSATSSAAALTVTAAPTPVAITTQPVSLTRNVGEAAAFTVAVSGTAPFMYQWRKNGADIPGANAATYTLASVLPGDAANYSVHVTNAGGTATSSAATLTVNVPTGGVQIVAETFADGNRTGSTPPESLAWFVSAASSNATVTNGATTVTANNGSRHFMAYFTPQALAVGDALALDFDFRVTAPVNIVNGFRVALLNSYVTDPRILITADNSSPGTFTYTGYAAFATPAPVAGANPLTLRKRPVGASAGTIITGSNYAQVGVSGGAVGTGFAADTDYHGKLFIERLEESRVRITAAFTGGALAGHALSFEDASAVLTSFDVIAFGVATGGSPTASAVGSFTLDNILVTYSPAPPPPASGYAAWNETHFTADERANAAISGALADPDADGLANLVEYALGFDPREVDTAAVPHATFAEDFWSFNYTRPLDRGDVVYAVEVSPNLQTWTTDGVTHEQVAIAGETATWQARYPQASAANLFFRLRIAPASP